MRLIDWESTAVEIPPVEGVISHAFFHLQIQQRTTDLYATSATITTTVFRFLPFIGYVHIGFRCVSLHFQAFGPLPGPSLFRARPQPGMSLACKHLARAASGAHACCCKLRVGTLASGAVLQRRATARPANGAAADLNRLEAPAF